MKCGILFSILSLLLAIYALVYGDWFLLLLWPALSCGLVSLGYLKLGVGVFGKRADGSMSFSSIMLLLPYLLYLWSIWHIVRFFSREPSLNTLGDDIFFGRRLLSHELPVGIQTVVDLTSEFPEPAALRGVHNYISIPILDASNLSPRKLAKVAQELATAETPMFIHCAQGHGRTGLVSALLLIARGDAVNPEDALERLQAVRPLARLSQVQMRTLDEAAAIIRTTE